MTKYLLLVSFYLLPFSLTAQDWRWTVKGGSMDQNPSNPPEEEVVDMATDPNGNVYVLSLVNQGNAYVAGMNKQSYGSSDWMLASFKCDGTLRWAKVIGGPKSDYPAAMAIDHNGGVYVSGQISLNGGGSFVGNIDADATVPQGAKGLYLIKYDTSGNYQWYKTPQADTVTPQATQYTYSIDMAVEPNGALHWFCNLPKGEFGGPGGFVSNALGVYMLKYNAAGNFGGGMNLDISFAGTSATGAKMVRNHKSGRLYFAGNTGLSTNVVKVGSATLSGTMYVICLNSSGQVEWYRQNTDPDSYSRFTGRPVLDEAGNLYLTGEGRPSGQTSQATSFNGFVIQDNGNASMRPLVIALNPDGNNIWATAATNVNAAGGGTNIALRNSGEVWVISSFTGSIKWLYYNTTYNLPGANYKILITRFHTQTGKVLGMDTIMGNSGTKVYPTAIAATRDNVFIGGKMEGSVTKGGNTVTKTGGLYDWFVTKYGYGCNCNNIPEPKFTFTRVGDKQVNYTYTGSGQTSLTWDFGDGTSSTQTSPSHNYSQNSFYQTCVTVSNSCGDNIYCQDIFLWPVGTKEVETTAGEVKIYPNPANEYLYVEGAAAGMQLSIQNTLGQVLHSRVVSNSKEAINISQYVPGSYVVLLTAGDGNRSVVKVTKQ
ncbi:PKD domain-containing protein [Polluticoccus soli]|uniref:PKD domain-containing protein n=1 Tax=Polluticoccus soli TaxID=3034150 RepID=UPI0023E27B8A|nr:PKD domain-containing protein [Flavipsychrobacter sp. JY13-12]